MRRPIISVGSATATFIIGVASTIGWHGYSNELSPCRVAQNPARYDRKVVRVRGAATLMSSGLPRNYLFVHDDECQIPDSVIGIELDESYKPESGVEEFLKDPRNEIRHSQVLVVGSFERWMGCFGPRFGIRATQIKLLTPITTEPLQKRSISP